MLESRWERKIMHIWMAAIDESLLFIHLTAAAIYGADLRIWVFMDPVIVTVN